MDFRGFICSGFRMFRVSDVRGFRFLPKNAFKTAFFCDTNLYYLTLEGYNSINFKDWGIFHRCFWKNWTLAFITAVGRHTAIKFRENFSKISWRVHRYFSKIYRRFLEDFLKIFRKIFQMFRESLLSKRSYLILCFAKILHMLGLFNSLILSLSLCLCLCTVSYTHLTLPTTPYV